MFESFIILLLLGLFGYMCYTTGRTQAVNEIEAHEREEAEHRREDAIKINRERDPWTR